MFTIGLLSWRSALILIAPSGFLFQLFSKACLRTLCIAVRSVSETSWEHWSKILARAAAMPTFDRNALLEKLHDEMEQNLQVGSL